MPISEIKFTDDELGLIMECIMYQMLKMTMQSPERDDLAQLYGKLMATRIITSGGGVSI